MRSQSLVNRLLAASLFTTSCLGTLALFGAVPLLPRLATQVARTLPNPSQFALDNVLPQSTSQQYRMWMAEVPATARFRVQQGNPKKSQIDPRRYRSR